MDYKNTDNYKGLTPANKILFDDAIAALQLVQNAVKATTNTYNFMALLKSLGNEPQHTLDIT